MKGRGGERRSGISVLMAQQDDDPCAWNIWLIIIILSTISTNIPDPFSPPLPIVHRFQQVIWAASCISKELLHVGSRWSSYLCSSMWKVCRSTSLMSSFLLLQQCPTYLICLTCIVFVDGWWLYSCCFVGCCLQDLFNIAHSILV